VDRGEAGLIELAGEAIVVHHALVLGHATIQLLVFETVVYHCCFSKVLN